jgi:hypothetical protein
VNYYLRSYALAALHAPGYVAVRLSRQVGSLAILPFGSTALQYTVESRAVVASQAGTDRFYRNWLDRYERRLTGSVVSPLQAVSAESTVSLLYTLSGLAMSVLTLLAGVRAWFRPLSSQARPLLACWTVIIFLVAATNVLIAVVHTFDIGPAARYSTMQSPIFVLLGFVSSLVVLADNPELVRGAGEAGPLDGRQRG